MYWIAIALLVLLVIIVMYYLSTHTIATASVGQSCASMKCGTGATCNDKDKMCYETCRDTATRKAADIPRKNIYYCDYGAEPTPTPPTPPTPPPVPPTPPAVALAKVGESCLTARCDDDLWCDSLDKMCHEPAFGTRTRGSTYIPMKTAYAFDYGTESPWRLPPFTPQPAKFAQLGESCANRACDTNSWCNPNDKMCYETCHATRLIGANNMPRKNIYYCDYQGQAVV
jgi:hypothetical protein